MATQQKSPLHRGRRIRRPPISPGRRSLILALWGIAFLVLLSIPLAKIPIISLIPTLLKGVFGLGYYFIPIALFAGGYLLLAYPGTLGSLQALICWIIPLPVGSLHHAIFCAGETSEASVQLLWETGTALKSGGVISGGLAQALISAAGNTGTTVLCGLFLMALLGAVFLPSLLKQKTPGRRQSGRHYAQETSASSVSYRLKSDICTPGHTSPKRVQPAGKSKIFEYDIPMDGDAALEQPDLTSSHEDVEPSSFYRPKSDSTHTPASMILHILEEPFQIPSDSSPVSAPVKPSPPVKPPAAWTPFVWTPAIRSAPAWVIPDSSTNKSHKIDESKHSKPENAHAEEQAVTSGDDLADGRNQADLSFILIGYIKPQKVQRTTRKSPANILQAHNRPRPLALPLARNTLLLSGRNAISPIKRLPSPVPVLRLPPPLLYSQFSQLSDEMIFSVSKEISACKESELRKDCFVLIDYTPPQRRVYNLRSSKPRRTTSGPVRGLPSPAPVLLLPPASVTEEFPAQNLEEKNAVYTLPPLELFNYHPISEAVEDTAGLSSNAERLNDVLKSFGVKAACGEVIRGPAVTRYEFTLERGVKLSKITNLADDIALALGASGVRIAPVPGKISIVGIEVPNKHITPVYIREVLDSPEFRTHHSPAAFTIGKDIGNRSVIGDIAKLPHILIAGTTGSGKSVCTNSLIISTLCRASPTDVKFIMIDPKMVELAPYNGIPHLLVPVVTDPKKAAGALQWAVYEMMKRYKQFSELGVKKLAEYNARADTDTEMEHMSTVVIVIDELADLMLAAAKEVEESICRVAQMGRAAGMHLVIATQRPSSDVITGLMKANIPSRIAFAVASSLESRIILDSSGAEKLVGRGDMLYAPLGTSKPRRVQGCYITPEEIERVVRHVKATGEAQYSDEVMEKMEESIKEQEAKIESENVAAANAPAHEDERLLRTAVEVFLDCGQASVSMLQRRLKLGYSRAARLVDQMEERGYVGPFEGSKPRKILISRAEWDEICSSNDIEDEYL